MWVGHRFAWGAKGPQRGDKATPRGREGPTHGDGPRGMAGAESGRSGRCGYLFGVDQRPAGGKAAAVEADRAAEHKASVRVHRQAAAALATHHHVVQYVPLQRSSGEPQAQAEGGGHRPGLLGPLHVLRSSP